MLNLLFIQAGTRWKFTEGGNIYVDHNFNNHVWERYKRHCDKLTVLLRREEKIYSEEEAASKFNLVDLNIVNAVSLPDLYRPVKNFFSPRLRKIFVSVMEQEIKKADRVIIRSFLNIYGTEAYRICRKYNKKFLVEVPDFAWEIRWHHSFMRKFLAPFTEYRYKKYIASSPFVIYVTQEAQQKRYPTKGKYVGCSNVEIGRLDDNVAANYREKVSSDGKIIFGTAAYLLNRTKGQDYVIRALAELRKKGINNIEYHLIGEGSPDRFIKLAEKLGVSDSVKAYGLVSHDKIFDWYDHLDVYIQSSFQEGLCRATIEAMSRAIPVVCSDVGGSSELAAQDMLFRPGNVKQICAVMEKMLDPEVRKRESLRSFTKAHDYDKAKLDARRNEFLAEFMK